MMKRNNNYIEYKINKKAIFFIIFLFIIVAIIELFYMNYFKNLIYENVYKNIDKFGNQITSQLRLSITEQKKIINLLLDYIDRHYLESVDEIYDSFNEKIDDYHFTRLVILDENGNGTTSDGFKVENYPNIQEFFKKSTDDIYITENIPSAVSNNLQQVNIYSRVFTLNNKKMLLMATVDSSYYQELLTNKLFGKGGTYLITKEGNVLIDSFNNIKDFSHNIYDYFKTRYNITSNSEIKKIDEMKENILAKKTGVLDISFIDSKNKETYFVHYENLNINDWYVVTTASDSTIAYEFLKLETISTSICLVLIFIVAISSVIITVSTQKKSKKIYTTAYIDPLTELGNSNYFKENGSIYLAQNQASNSYIITLDIDKFKALNSIYGYDFCNKILKELGQNLKKILPENNITCRISNDIFASIFYYNENINTFLESLYNNLSVLKIDNTNIKLNLSIGAYNIQFDDKNINKILDKSYLAREQVKGVYDSDYYLFDEKLENKLLEEQQIESIMKESLDLNEFIIYYQPKVFAKDGKFAGAEALVRWNKNDQLISPSKFIPLFEKNKFIIKLDLYVFEKVCQDLASWREKYNFIPTVSINVSKEHFVNENFIDKYVKICEKYKIKPNEIELEITESATIDENIDILTVLNKVKEKGFIISLDDFGTGYSSLSILQTMPIDIIKIDRVFVKKANLGNDNNIINYIMLISKQLGAKTIIEGVETKEEVDFINRIQGDIIQGYYFSKPLPKDDFEKYLENKD